MRKIGSIEIINLVICDDVRTEADSNKHILVGTYSGDFLMPSIPATVLIASYFDCKVPDGKHQLEIKYSGPGKGQAVFQAEIEHPHGGGGATIVLQRIGVNFEKEGIFRISGRVPGGRWNRLVEKKVMLRGPTA